MQVPLIPIDESARLRSLQILGLLDSPAEDRFDRFTRLVCRFFNVPIALVSLVDSDRQWFKSKIGLDAAQTPRDISFCGHAILKDRIFFIPDALLDTRFRDNPLVRDEPHIRMYAGAPLRTADGSRIGTLCIIDRVPRSLDEEQLGFLRDIADSVELELNQASYREAVGHLRDSEAALKSIWDAVDEGILVIDDDWLIRQANSTAEKMFVRSEAELRGSDIRESLEGFEKMLEHGLGGRALKTIKPENAVSMQGATGIRKDHSRFPVELSLSSYRQGGGRRIVCAIRDATEKTNMERAARQYTSALEELHTITTDADLDFESKIVAILELGRRVFSLSLAIVSRIQGPDYVIEYACADSAPPAAGTCFEFANTYCSHTLAADRPVGMHQVRQSSIRDHPCYREFKLESYLGTPLLVNGKRYGTLNFSSQEPRPRAFSEGDFGLIQLFANWIGHEKWRQMTREKLQRETALRQAILDSTNLAIMTTDSKGCITSYNKGAATMLGYDADEIVGRSGPHGFQQNPAGLAGRHSDECIDPAIPDPVFSLWIEQIQRAQISEFEETFYSKTGDAIPVMVSLTAVRDGGKEFGGYLIIARDISERKRSEKALIAAKDEAEASNRMKTEFINMMSHELRTPLTVILGYLPILKRLNSGWHPDPLKEIVAHMQLSGDHLLQLINDLLDLSKIEAGRLNLNIQYCSLESAIADVIASLRQKADEKQLRLVSMLKVPEIYADPLRLRQILFNLIGNAIKFTQRGMVRVETEREEGWIIIAVSDTGIGIPEAELCGIFERFVQVDTSSTRQAGGTGLGLAITSSLVELHQGAIEVESETGVGTKFTVRIPNVPGSAHGGD